MCEGGSVMRKDRQHFGSIFESIPPKVGRHNMLFIAVDAPALSSLSVQCTHTAEVCFFVKISQVPRTRHFVRATTSAGDAIDVTVAAAG